MNSPSACLSSSKDRYNPNGHSQDFLDIYKGSQEGSRFSKKKLYSILIDPHVKVARLLGGEANPTLGDGFIPGEWVETDHCEQSQVTRWSDLVGGVVKACLLIYLPRQLTLCTQRGQSPSRGGPPCTAR